MFPENFEYHAPANVEEAIKLLAKYKDDAKILTGGMSLIPLMKLRLATPAHVVDLRKCKGLAGIKEKGGKITIGAMTTYAELARSSVLAGKCPLVAQTAAEIGDAQVRNRGTIGGSLVHADPAADLPAAMLALGAEFTLLGKGGKERGVAADKFFLDTLTSAAKPGEILTSITVPATGKHTNYAKIAHQASGFALAGVAVTLELKGSTCSGAGVGVTGVDYRPFRAKSVEAALKGRILDAGSIAAAAAKVLDDIQEPMDDPLNASADYRKHIAQVCTRRAIERAMAG
ncbi:MAG: xanthine dehydrogenase family protein subunit M [Candidatus Lambdaproteobacteria bacterium]|nr:xanthine dehydrogenase family protein subunit M [Candidatus Lambdaproteobacteria bacterium]